MTDYSTMKAGPEMDALIAEKIMGWGVCRDPECEGCDCPVYIEDGEWYVFHPDHEEMMFAPSSDDPDQLLRGDSDAWEVIEKVYSLGLGWMLISKYGENRYVAYEETDCADYDFGKWYAEGNTRREAICRAALMAVEKGEKT